MQADGGTQGLLLLAGEGMQCDATLRTRREGGASIAGIAGTADNTAASIRRIGNACIGGGAGGAFAREGAAKLLLDDAPGLEKRNVIHHFLIDEAGGESREKDLPLKDGDELLLRKKYSVFG